MKHAKKALFCILLLSSMLFCSCRIGNASEPERVYLVSAIGFDRCESGVRLTVEVPISRENETQSMETQLFSGEGDRIEAALRDITVGLARELSFSHCALMVIGEDLTREETDAAFSFAANGASLPIAAQVVLAPNAEELLGGGSLSAPAVGYDVPSILREASALLGIDTRSRVYEIYAGAAESEVTVLPYFSAGEENALPRAVFEGLAILRRDFPTVLLNEEESVFYAILTERFKGTSGGVGSFGDLALSRVKYDVSYSPDSVPTVTLSVKMKADGTSDLSALQSLQERINQNCESLYQRLMREGGDPIDLLRRISIDHAAGEPSEIFSQIELRVCCVIEGEEDAR